MCWSDMKSLVGLLTLALAPLTWTTMAFHKHELRYYEAEIMIISGDSMVKGDSLMLGVYVPIPYNVTNCTVTSFLYNCSNIPRASCYVFECGEIIAENAVTVSSNINISSGIIIPTRNIELMIKRLVAMVTASVNDHVEISCPVIVMDHKDAFILSSNKVIFSVTMGNQQLMTYASSTTAERAGRDTANTKKPLIAKNQFYYVTVITIILMLIFIILFVLFVAVKGVCRVYRKCTRKV